VLHLIKVDSTVAVALRKINFFCNCPGNLTVPGKIVLVTKCVRCWVRARHFSSRQEILTELYVGLCEVFPLLLPDFNQNWDVPTVLSKTVQHYVSWKSVERFSDCCRGTGSYDESILCIFAVSFPEHVRTNEQCSGVRCAAVTNVLSMIWGSHGCDYEYGCLPGCSAV
jgi:predicted Na+-dependent transporter